MILSYNKGTILVGDVDNGGGAACVQAGDIWEIATFLFIFLLT